jgi:hypothetical protein
MKEQDKQAPVVHNTFNAPIGQYVQYQHIEHMTIGSDGQIHVASSSQSTPQPATPSAPVSITPKKEGDELLDLLFLPDDQERDKTEALLGGILRGKSVKTKVLRELYQNRRYFNLDAMTHEDKAAVLTAWAKKLKLMQNFKGDAFTEKDFAAYC